jgi:hypothetical protein
MTPMLPHDLKPEQFNGYPPEAKKLVTNYLPVLRRLPLSFLPSLLREAIEYDYKFPPERKELEGELGNLNSLSAEQLKEWLQGFTQIQLSTTLENFDWINSPGQFVEQLSSHLWTTHQLDAFRMAAMAYADRLRAAVPPEGPATRRLGITVVGQSVASFEGPLFRKLRPHGAYYRRVNPANGLRALLDGVTARAKAHPAPYAHWYIDGGKRAEHDPAITSVSYSALSAPRAALLGKMRAEIDRPGMGPEALRTHLAQLRPADLGLASGDEVLDRFRIKMLTEGSGTQIFSTTFVQWTTREALRRAQPLTLLARFAPRQRQRSMNEMLAATAESAELDPVGSLVDADMGAYYNWVNQQRLAGANESAFLVWFEGQSQALAIGPTTPRGTTSNSATDLEQILASFA